jgi:hypothetical protein
MFLRKWCHWKNWEPGFGCVTEEMGSLKNVHGPGCATKKMGSLNNGHGPGCATEEVAIENTGLPDKWHPCFALLAQSACA